MSVPIYQKFFKCIFLIINSICSIIGVVLIIFGGWLLLVDFKKEENILSVISDNTVVSIFCVIFGLITMLVSTFGICGAIADSLVFIKGYTYILAFLTIAQMSIIVFASIGNNYTNLVEGVWNGATDEGKEWIQHELNCCGFDGAKEYNGAITASCLDGGNLADGFTVISVGCRSRLIDWAQANSIPLFVGGGIILGLQFIMLILSVAVTSANNRRNKKLANNKKISLNRNQVDRSQLGHTNMRNSNNGNINQGFDLASYHTHSQAQERDFRSENRSRTVNDNQTENDTSFGADRDGITEVTRDTRLDTAQTAQTANTANFNSNNNAELTSDCSSPEVKPRSITEYLQQKETTSAKKTKKSKKSSKPKLAKLEEHVHTHNPHQPAHSTLERPQYHNRSNPPRGNQPHHLIHDHAYQLDQDHLALTNRHHNYLVDSLDSEAFGEKVYAAPISEDHSVLISTEKSLRK